VVTAYRFPEHRRELLAPSGGHARGLSVRAGIGNSVYRWAWDDGIIEELDANGGGLISRPEFAAMFPDEERM
jgi:hypothetical protein